MIEILKSIIIPGVSVLFSIVVLIVQIVKGRSSVVKTSFVSLLEKLPLFISDAEQKGFADGSSKLNYVVELSCSYLVSNLGKSYESIYKQYSSLIICLVESILTTPQKKEAY